VERWIGRPEAVDEGPVRLGVAVVLSGAAVGFFRQEAAPGLAASAGGALLVVALAWLFYHRVGLRWVGRFWPGAALGMATGLLLFCLCPPGLPLGLIFSLAAVAVLLEGAFRGLRVPVALGGVMIAWPVAWLWHVHSGTGYVAPFVLRSQLEPIALWSNFQLELDPLRLYIGNVAGPLGATSFGLAMIGFTILAYLRKTSWLFLLAFFVPIATAMAATGQSLPVYLISGPALLFAGLIAADTGKLPLATSWKVGAGAAGGLLSALLLLRGGGSESYGAGILGVLLVVSLFQLFGLAGSPAVIRGEQDQPRPQVARARAPGQLAALVVFAPMGLLLVWRDKALPRSQRQILAMLGLLLYVVAVGGALIWLWALRLPA
jgi:hypothetical protein